MIHPTRTNLILIREKARSVETSVGILKARKQALITELLNTARPFLRSREEIRTLYGAALLELGLSIGNEGDETIASVAIAAARDFRIEIAEKSIWGLKYRDVAARDRAVRDPGDRGYDYAGPTPHLEEGILGFERLLEAMINHAEYESKLRRLAEEVLRTTRKIRVLEQHLLPSLRNEIRLISAFIAEREREAHFRLKRFKRLSTGAWTGRDQR